MRVLRSLSFGIGLAAMSLAIGLTAPVLAANAELRGEAMQAGFGRLAFTFDEPVTTRVRISNGVLVVGFSQPVKVDPSRISRELPAYVSLARIDPDGRGLRFALARTYRANLLEAGDRAFVDLLPDNWAGQLPGLPPEVVAELTKRLRLAESRARDAARAPAQAPKPLGFRSARLPTLDRLMFSVPDEAQLTPRLEDGQLTLAFDQPLQLEAGKIRSLLPADFTLESAKNEADRTELVFTVPKERELRSFRDDSGWTVDLARTAKPGAPILASLQAGPPQPGPKPAEPQPATAAPKAASASTQAPASPPAAAPAAPAATSPVVAPAPVDPTPKEILITSAVDGDGGRIDFRFPRPTGAAAFAEPGLVTLVFDTRDTLDPDRLKGVLPGLVQDVTVMRESKVTVLRLKTRRQQVTRLSDDGATWSLSFGEKVGKPAGALAPRRDSDERGQTVVAVPVPAMTGVHWLENRDGGAPMAVATAFGPTRAVSKPYRFVEFSLLQTAHGVAVSALADDIMVRAGADEALIGRSGGLIVSLDAGKPNDPEKKAADSVAAPLLNPQLWSSLRTDAVREKTQELLRDVADASRARKSDARLALARFLAANAMLPEAAGPLNALLADDPAMRGNREALFLRGVIAALMHRHAEALKAFEAAPIKEEAEAGLWRALAEQRLGRNAPALAGFRRAEAALDSYPTDLQAQFRPAMARAALAAQDTMVAERQIAHLAELPANLVPAEELALLRAMLDDASGRPEAALNGYRPLFEAVSRPVAAEAQLRAVKLARTEKRPDFSVDEAAARLETVSAIWRGGEVEIEALAELGRIYAQQQRWRDAFQVARRANENFPDHPATRLLHDETAQRFEALFSDPDLEKLPRLEALALFYDFKEFLPIGRRGDEITRLLADRLVELDLLDQAGDILRYQMEKRLNGAARSTVAARLAMIRLMNGKPAEALQALVSTRLAELPGDVKRARLLLEAKALSDLSRTDRALDLLEGESGPEVDRLHADILWSGRRWREAGEALERILGESWRGETPLRDAERGDTMRAAIAYAMADEALSLDRLRTKFAGKMAQSADARLFAFVTGASRASAADIREVARSAAGSDTMQDFLKEYRKRYPAYSSAVRDRPKPEEAEAKPPARPGQG
ncbi:tetratricopeptide repeat protein [Bosea sp. (in: a-proteobacteria)]|uniref:tetratricopeptide repeat protein n=1 Tax=Bosea sp. (in: a-proteobacteria) TaxID=1871050 RepID=UPI002FCA324B